MINIDLETKSVTVTDSEGDMVRIDGNEYQLVNGSILVVNLPSFFDVEVFKKVEENHIPKPIVEPIIEEEPLP